MGDNSSVSGVPRVGHWVRIKVVDGLSEEEIEEVAGELELPLGLKKMLLLDPREGIEYQSISKRVCQKIGKRKR